MDLNLARQRRAEDTIANVKEISRDVFMHRERVPELNLLRLLDAHLAARTLERLLEKWLRSGINLNERNDDAPL